VRPYRTLDDKIEGVVITFVDVTRLKNAEKALVLANDNLETRVQTRTRELEESNLRLEQTGVLFSNLFHVNPIPTSLTRLEDGYFLDVNEAYCRFFGVKREEVIERTSRELGLPFQGQQRAELLARVKSEGTIRDQEMEFKLHSGEARSVLVSLRHMNVVNTGALLSTFIDITERVNSERQIRTLAANLTAAEQKERQRISQILHDDLQQRLFAVKMQLSFLQQAYQQGNQEGIQADTVNLQNWLGEAIDTTRRLSVDLSPVVLKGSSLADSLAWLAEDMHERYGLQVKMDVKGSLPVVDEHLRILLFESMRELLFNIVKHAETQKATVHIEPVDGKVRVVLSDEGKGFDAGKVVFDPKAAHGLLDVRNRLNLLACEMRLESHPGKGTQVTIEVPI
jgi:PAS domain S-box-containing protein